MDELMVQPDLGTLIYKISQRQFKTLLAPFLRLIQQSMSNISIENNPYEAVYRGAGLLLSNEMNKTQAEELVRHLGLIYNTFGMVIKDFIRIVGPKFEQHPQSQAESTTAPKTVFQPATKPVQIESDRYRYCPTNVKNVNEVKLTQKSLLQDLNQDKINRKKQPQRLGQSELSSQFEFQIQNYAYNNDKRSGNSVKSQKSEHKSKSDQSSHFFSQFIKNDKKQPQTKPLQIKSKYINNSQTIIVEEDQPQIENIQQIPVGGQQRCRQGGYFQDDFSEFSFKNGKETTKEIVRVLPGRTKKERQNFKGIVCGDCERYYKTMGLEGAVICECSSRHRSNIPMRRFEKNGFTQQFDID